MKEVIFSVEVVNELLTYLGQRPYVEVAKYIQALQTTGKFVEEAKEESKEEAKKEE